MIFTNPQLAAQLTWLERTAGAAGAQKFKGGKIGVPGEFSGQYVSALLHTPRGQALLVNLLDELTAGRVIAVIDVDAHNSSTTNKPDGMCLHGGLLMDAWQTPRSAN